MSRLASAVEVAGLTKRYGDLLAVDGIDFSIAPGEVVAILGPNGAGKSTTIEVLEGYRTRDAGRVSVLGEDPSDASPELRNRIGIVLQSSGFDRELTVRETLDLYALSYSDPRPVEEVMELVDIAHKADERMRTLSGGQQRRVDLGLGLIGNPELLFLDEPTTGFDPAARRASWEILRRLTDSGTTIVLTTHYMDEADHLADRIIVLADGRIVVDDTPDAIIGTAPRNPVMTLSVDVRLVDSLSERFGARMEADAGIVRIETVDPARDLYELADWAIGHGFQLDSLEIAKPSLEDVYLDLLGRSSMPGEEVEKQ